MRTASTWSLQIVGTSSAGASPPRLDQGLGQGYLPPPRSTERCAVAGVVEVAVAGGASRTRDGCRRLGRGEVVAVSADRRELGRVDRRTADEGAVDVLLGHDRRDVARLHAAAVEHAYAVRDVTAVELGEQGADGGAHLLRV